MDLHGYPEDSELDLIEKWDFMDTFGLLNYIKERWAYSDWGYIEKWGKSDEGKPLLFLELHTAGWSGNESIIYALKRNLICGMFHTKWLRGGHYYFEINPSTFRYKTVSDYCKEVKVSRQYIYHNHQKFDWIHISKNKKLIKPKNQ